MRDLELECLPQWRYCIIDRGSKAPKYPKWNHIAYKLEDIPKSKNLGILLGPKSGGILAIDFDGASAFEYWMDNIPYDLEHLLTNTVVWQGRIGRCQAALRVDERIWDMVPTKFAIQTGVGADGRPEQLEWRWSEGDVGIQSVLPPSIHPDTKQPYKWLNPPSNSGVMMLPDEILAWAIQYRRPKITAVSVNSQQIPKDITESDVLDMLQTLHKYYPALPYEDWLRVTWAVGNAIGDVAAVNVLQQVYPEQKHGEYRRKLASGGRDGGVTLGTVVYMIRQREPNYRKRQNIDWRDVRQSLINKYAIRN